MRATLPIAALLAAVLALGPGRSGAQEDETAADAPLEDTAEDADVPAGPVMRRPPPNDEVADAPPPTPVMAEEAAPDDRPVLEVLDASVFEGVFAPYTVHDGREIPEPLTARPGDPVRGRRLYHNFSRTGCSLCHGTAEAPRRPDSDRTAPPLHRVAERLTSARLRLWIVAPDTIRPDTPMPAFHKPGQREDVQDPLYGGPRLTAAEVEDIVAYLSDAGMSKAE